MASSVLQALHTCGAHTNVIINVELGIGMDKLLSLLVSFTIFSNGQGRCYRAWLSGGFLLEQGLASALVQLTVAFFCVQYVVAQLVCRGFLWSCCCRGARLSAWISEPLWAAAPYTPGQPLLFIT